MKKSNREALLNCIDMASFAINEINLYLDTHPCDEDALAYYEEYKAIRNQAMQEYTRYFGPLTVDNVCTENKWTWVQDPWPWEGRC